MDLSRRRLSYDEVFRRADPPFFASKHKPAEEVATAATGLERKLKEAIEANQKSIAYCAIDAMVTNCGRSRGITTKQQADILFREWAHFRTLLLGGHTAESGASIVWHSIQGACDAHT